jgi:ribosome-associated protein
MAAMVNYCDYFVICSANTNRLVAAIVDHIEEKLNELGIDLHVSQGTKQSNWVVIDAGDVLVHIFQKDLREFYKLEYLWRDAKTLNWAEKK